MTVFIIVAALLALIALACVLPPLLRRHATSPQLRRDVANLAILRDQLAELDADLRAGTLSTEQYERAKLDLERRVLDETARTESTPTQASVSHGAKLTAIVLAVVVPLGAIALYSQLGSPGAVVPQQAAMPQHQFTPEQIEEMVARLAERMQQQPDDAQGWAILARSYYVMQRFPEAVKAYEQWVRLDPKNADALTDYADALAMSQGRRLEGKPLELLQQALAVDPEHWKALALIGTAAFDRKDYKTALAHWEKLLASVPPDSEFARSIGASIAEARELAGGQAASPQQAVQAASPPQATQAGVKGTVSLAPELIAKAEPTDTVFIFARAANGPKMPLAVVRRQVKDLPAEFTLDDSHAMTPNARLSSQPEVVIGARVSKSASATIQSGDLQGFSKTVKPGATGVAVVIDQRVP